MVFVQFRKSMKFVSKLVDIITENVRANHSTLSLLCCQFTNINNHVIKKNILKSLEMTFVKIILFIYGHTLRYLRFYISLFWVLKNWVKVCTDAK